MVDDNRTRPITSSASRSVSSTCLRIRVHAGPDAGLDRVVDALRVIVGRAETADVRLSDPTVSQFHLELSVGPRGIAIVDLGSRNGTRVQGVEIERAFVLPGAAVVLGSTTLSVEQSGAFQTPLSGAGSFGGLLGRSRPMRELFALLERLARTELSVLMQGETGTGKELAARGLHDGGARGAGPFVAIDCTALPLQLAPSLLFGHEKGAFTGATDRRIGLIESASGGTLFLDEVGELPPDVQPMLLRVLQQREVLTIGGNRPRAVDIRVIAASWRDLRSMVNAGTFREDLYYRLSQATVRIPPLEERREDIGELIQHFLDRLPAHGPGARSIAKDALDAIAQRHFPGNVRELQSTVERLAMLADGPIISVADLAFERMLASARAPVAQADGPLEPFRAAKQTVVDEFERAYLARLLDRADGNITKAASIAGLERHNLRHLLKQHGLYERVQKPRG